MALALQDPQQHLHRVLDVVRHGPRNLISTVVADSWARCLNVHHLDPSQVRRPPVLGRAALDERRERLLDVIECARYEMSTLYQQLGDPQAAIVLTDTDGVILHMASSPEFEREVQPLGLEVGAVWSEAEAGTNGMGTCVAAARPVAVVQDDHFFTHYTSLTCSAVPVHDPAGEICAVLDVSSRSQVPQQHLLLLLGMTARMIENRLIDLRFRDAHPIHFHSRPEFVYTLHEGKLVVDRSGLVLAANRSALTQLGVDSVRQIRGHRLDQIFQTTLDDMLQRSHRAAFHPVVTYRANAANRFFAVARQPTRAVTAARSAPTTSAACEAPSSGRAQQMTPRFADPVLQARFATAQRVVARGTPLLLRGETGAGKEVFARGVHASSPRAGGPFVAINCASLPESLIEAELFGYRAGAFTGAERRGRPGKILQADGGTLFLDEIGDMPLALQARLLRVLDERMVTPLGADEPQRVDFQLISASHCNLGELVARGHFRQDLYFRLAGIELEVPALRERSDRAELIRDVLADEGGADMPISPAAWDLLMRHPWPGNVRQLRHVLRCAVALADGQTITPEHLPSLRGEPGCADRESGAETPQAPSLDPAQAQERQALLDLLEAQRWNVSHVAKRLGVSRNTLYRRMHRLHIPLAPNN
ncbi:sigma-54-dependent Fis family transcriptional regulator [Calidifontimicrobium sp. SYSU G02091]|uniref:sigma-54-dependent Fis family transcriptional regulator n=1 Tax=Calidifontimicrobium sp. SYSU G02091 TaxID=2926421 RepID=UPI001F52EAEC|nr:sigma-54-dependent Fis family transcriptional regulator [Calidifontimicrobium sp. SYSU G02091]MCI1192558.1 sigma-54-dependent Fis family transcriptional regulator [Calidifontimicrobium sp. SYSU G02091]